jgi:D-3-phosphoglycerate dehydrogenase
LLRPSLDSINMVNAPVIAKDRGIKISETRRQDEGDYHTLVRVKVETGDGVLNVAGSLFSSKPRIVEIDDVTLEAELAPRMLFSRNEDKPGFIGRLGSKLGESKINIANFNLGRNKPGANAACLVSFDSDISEAVLNEIRKLPGVVGAYALKFDV